MESHWKTAKFPLPGNANGRQTQPESQTNKGKKHVAARKSGRSETYENVAPAAAYQTS
jgi:hypothetical protein